VSAGEAFAAAPPLRIRALRAAARHLPRGRYRVVELAGAQGRFTAALAADAGGARFQCDLADQICREVAVTGLYEPPVSRVMQHLLPRGGSMVDAGANWGYYALLAAAAVGPSGTVIALEPDPRPFARLQGNLALNGFGQVRALPVAASAAAGRAHVHGYADADANRGTSQLHDAPAAGPNSFAVACVTLDELSRTFAAIDLVKIDVEGAELAALGGMEEGLRTQRYRSIVLELHPGLLADRGTSAEACIERLTRHGYRGATIDGAPRAYRAAIDPRIPLESLLGPLDGWRDSAWPHLLWRAR
jgi:FkbM family methyltransferase